MSRANHDLQPLPERVRTSCRHFLQHAANARVRLNPEALARLARDLGSTPAEIPAGLEAHSHFVQGDPEQVALFVLALDAVNFGSGYFADLDPTPCSGGGFGYFDVAHGLTGFFRAQSGNVTPAQLADLTVLELLALFHQDAENPSAVELMELFGQALGDLAEFLEDQGGSESLIRSAQGSAACLAEKLTAMPFYQDKTLCHGLPVYFYKRAQITCADLALAFRHEGLGAFHDLPTLTAFADNALPGILRAESVLEVVDPADAAAIDSGRLLPTNSEVEIALRAGAVVAVEDLRTAIENLTGETWTAMQIDHVLWNRSQRLKKRVSPCNMPLRAHRTQCVYY